jgi:hypothetical protein
MVGTKMLWKSAAAAVIAGGFLLLGGATMARADDYASCRRNVEKWESRLDHDVDHHGVNSWQANHDRHELAEARQGCERRFGNGFRDHGDSDHDGR